MRRRSLRWKRTTSSISVPVVEEEVVVVIIITMVDLDRRVDRRLRGVTSTDRLSVP